MAGQHPINQIDMIDGKIISLVNERRLLSHSRQLSRLRDGEPGLQTAWEVSVARRYSASLGRPGAAMSAILIQLCRIQESRGGDELGGRSREEGHRDGSAASSVELPAV